MSEEFIPQEGGPEATAAQALAQLLTGHSTETPDAAKAMIVKELMETKNLNRVTEVDNREIVLVSIINGVNLKADCSVVKEYVKQFLELRVSNNREGRKDVIEITRPSMMPPGGVGRPFWKFW